MTTEIIPLGTASAMPTRERHLSALALRRGGHVVLFDCGEGTQYQLIRAGIKRTHLDAVLISHLHGDHVYGLMGLLGTLTLLHHEAPLTLVGPEALEGLLGAMPGLLDGLTFPVTYVRIRDDFTSGVVYETTAYTVEARALRHRVFTVGYRFVEKTRPGTLLVDEARALGVTDFRHYRALKEGRSVVLADGRTVLPGQVLGPPRPGVVFAYVTDTRPCPAGVGLAQDADLLYHEATFAEDFRGRASETGHATAREAAGVARDAGARRLLLGHFSARYKDASVLVEEARAVFQNTEAAEELKGYKILAAGPPKF